MTYFEHSFRDLIEIEGGYGKNEDDLGGATNWGITETTARSNGYLGEMDKLSKDIAKQIYRKEYWDRQNLDKVCSISYPIAHEVFDTGVNMGIRVAAEFLQRALNALNNKGLDYSDVSVDGDIGNQTLNALKSYMTRRGPEGQRVLLRALNALQGAKYIELAEIRERNETFVYGWFLRRVT